MTRCSRAAIGPAVWAVFILTIAARPFAVGPQAAPGPQPAEARSLAQGPAGAAVAEYDIRAKAFLLGDMGSVGTALLERRLERKTAEIVKTCRFSGRAKPELARKGRDIGGELTTVTCSPSTAGR